MLALFVLSVTAAAQTATVPHLTVNATVANALQLNISSSVSGVIGTGTSNDFVVDLGNINALGIGTPATGVTVWRPRAQAPQASRSIQLRSS